VPRQFDDGERVFAIDARKLLQELVERVAECQIVEQSNIDFTGTRVPWKQGVPDIQSGRDDTSGSGSVGIGAPLTFRDHHAAGEKSAGSAIADRFKAPG
jgi:hypothetical protein